MRILLLATAVLIAATILFLRADEDNEPVEGAGALTLVGDSLNVGMEPYLREELSEWRIDAFDSVGRATREGVDELRRLRGSLAPVVVVSLGTNDPDGTESRFRSLVAQALELAGDDTCVVWATIVRDGIARKGFNDVLAEARDRHPNLRLVEWAALVEEHATMLASDLVHGTVEGYAQRAVETARAARACPRG